MPMFDRESLKARVEQAMAAEIPEGKKGAFIAVAAPDGTTEIRYAHRVNDVWQLGAIAYKQPKQKLTGMFEVRAAW